MYIKYMSKTLTFNYKHFNLILKKCSCYYVRVICFRYVAETKEFVYFCMVLTRHVFQKLSFPIMKTPRHNLFFVISRFKLITFHEKSLLFPLSIKRTIRYVRHNKIILKKKCVRDILLSS